ncbi:helix-turn-helix transcriptional regulator [Providencia hangzhouensis]|uniref:helix-turn-helix transcriptional regulator n=1 Tax=Providencia hangzhouensis TaxID=3031799 RepID=UPI003F4A75CF
MNLNELRSIGITELGAMGKIISSDLFKQITGLGRTTLDRLDKDNVLKKIYLGPRKFVYLLDEVNAYLDNCLINPTMYKEDEENIAQARQALEAKKAKQ